MSESRSQSLTFILSAIPLCLLLLLDNFALYLQGQPKAISHLSLAVLTAQLVCLLVFYKGQICNGQRSRLVAVNGYLFVYWGYWLLLSVCSNHHYVLTDMVSLCGIGLSLAIWFQPADMQLRKAILVFASLFGVLGVVVYGLIFLQLPWLALLPYNFFGQCFIGIILANLFLVIAKNRLQSFIALLPLAMMIFLLLNGVLSTLLIYFAHQSAVIFPNKFALALYFFLHLVLVAMIALPILTKTKFSYQTLLLLFFIALSLPIWANFSLIAG
ncbi:hypothetical protein [Avibacterium sp. 20-129]|uniref:hypothetical protein n=1 Tax=Avibacterium sp. 20-129 TaxID=2911525 RepID=UPI00224599B9|nr:hypothetical protein [Avibacterium sp. 20-129]MCW9698497.1 hypothetical protein [Avibacterium sp. 20-129]